MKPLAFTLAVALTWLAPRAADACGATPPSFTLLTDAQGSVPLGTKVLKLYVYGSSIQPRPPSVKLWLDRLGNAAPEFVPVTLRVKGEWLVEVDLGAGSIQPNFDYWLEVTGVEGEAGGNVGYTDKIRFRGVTAAALPKELGELELRSRKSGAIAFGGCGGSQEGEYALVALTPNAAAIPWLRAVKHQLVMDGKPLFEPELPLIDYVAKPSETVVRAIATCERDHQGDAGSLFEPGIEVVVPAGRHSLQWQSTLPNGAVLETDPLQVDLRCGDGTSSPSTSTDAGQATSNDAGSVRSGGRGAVDPSPPSKEDADSSVATGVDPSFAAPAPDDGCSVNHGRSTQAWGPALGLVLLSLMRRRRRRDS